MSKHLRGVTRTARDSGTHKDRRSIGSDAHATARLHRRGRHTQPAFLSELASRALDHGLVGLQLATEAVELARTEATLLEAEEHATRRCVQQKDEREQLGRRCHGAKTRVCGGGRSPCACRACGLRNAVVRALTVRGNSSYQPWDLTVPRARRDGVSVGINIQNVHTTRLYPQVTAHHEREVGSAGGVQARDAPHGRGRGGFEHSRHAHRAPAATQGGVAAVCPGAHGAVAARGRRRGSTDRLTYVRTIARCATGLRDPRINKCYRRGALLALLADILLAVGHPSTKRFALTLHDSQSAPTAGSWGGD
jgi:hypothetical protein